VLYDLFWVISRRLNFDDNTEMSKHVAVYIIYRDTVVVYNCVFVGGNGNINKIARYRY
jgi:hypothetical protein